MTRRLRPAPGRDWRTPAGPAPPDRPARPACPSRREPPAPRSQPSDHVRLPRGCIRGRVPARPESGNAAMPTRTCPFRIRLCPHRATEPYVTKVAFSSCLRLHEAVVEHSAGRAERIVLTPHRPVGEVTRDVLAAVRGLGGPVEIDPRPQEVPWQVPLDQDDEHAHYEPGEVAGYFAAATQ